MDDPRLELASEHTEEKEEVDLIDMTLSGTS
jgi:hypothetical protein